MGCQNYEEQSKCSALSSSAEPRWQYGARASRDARESGSSRLGSLASTGDRLYIRTMSDLMKKAISAVSQLADSDQDQIAEMMLAMSQDESIAVPPEHRDAVSEGLQQARAGKLASGEQVAAVWRRFET
jgi:predicted transcriptional regulator